MRFTLFALLIFSLNMFSCKKEDPIKTIYVSGLLADCENTSKEKCLQIKFNEDDDWTVYSNSISGFNYEEGMDYVLKVKESETENLTTSDYELIDIISQEKTPLTLGEGSWTVKSVYGITEFARAPFFTFTPSKNRVHGSTGCNKFFGNFPFTGNKFDISELKLTKMACPDNKTEDTFLKMLQNVTNYQIVDNTLHLLTDDDKILIKASHNETRQ